MTQYVRNAKEGKMRIDWQRYRKNTCTKCDKFTGAKPVFGKCMGNFDDIYECVRRKLFNREENHEVKELKT